MAYTRSIPLTQWLGSRRTAIVTLAEAHAVMGEVDGPGRPREIGRPIGHAYVLRVVAELQAFVRDLHDLAAERVVNLATSQAQYRALLIGAATEGRLIDRGNADLRSIEQDFQRLGIGELNGKIGALNSRWAHPNGRGDRAYYQGPHRASKRPCPWQPGPAGSTPRSGNRRHRNLGPSSTTRAGSDWKGARSHRVEPFGEHLRKRAVVKHMANKLRVGTTVRVPWGLNSDLEGKIVEIWGDPPTHVRVRLLLDGNEDEPVVLLLPPSALTAA